MAWTIPSTRGLAAVISATVFAGLLAAAPANASYMIKCNALIDTHMTCLAGGGACKAEYKAVEEECKCHKFIRGEWKFVVEAVGSDDVCSASIPEDDVPPPSEPRDPHGNTGKGNFDKGNFDRDRGGDPKGDSDRGNPR
jgi:hypothetical protein